MKTQEKYPEKEREKRLGHERQEFDLLDEYEYEELFLLADRWNSHEL